MIFVYKFKETMHHSQNILSRHSGVRRNPVKPIIYWMPFGIYTRRGDGMTATVLLQRFHDDMLSKMRILAQ
jgi:hypothetical protein